MAMAIPKKKTESTTSRFASRPQADRRVEAPGASPAGAVREPSYQEVSRRAFEIWEENGREPGHDLENWLKAETELRHAAPSF